MLHIFMCGHPYKVYTPGSGFLVNCMSMPCPLCRDKVYAALQGGEKSPPLPIPKDSLCKDKEDGRGI